LPLSGVRRSKPNIFNPTQPFAGPELQDCRNHHGCKGHQKDCRGSPLCDYLGIGQRHWSMLCDEDAKPARSCFGAEETYYDPRKQKALDPTPSSPRPSGGVFNIRHEKIPSKYADSYSRLSLFDK
jgi:hypothetical protein